MTAAVTAGRLEAFLVVPSGITISATNSGGGPTSVSLTAGTYTPTTFVAHVVTRLNAVRTPANWTGSLSTTTGLVTLNWTGAGTYSIAWTSTDARDMLGFTADLVGVTQGVASVGTKFHRGVWIPDCGLTLDGDPKRAPRVTDLRTTSGPSGGNFGVVAQYRYVHRNLRWTLVARNRVWEAEDAVKGSWEQWKEDTQFAQGHAWFSVLSAFHVYNQDGLILGQDLNSGAGPTSGWKASGDGWDAIEPRMANPGWAGVWVIEIPMLEASST